MKTLLDTNVLSELLRAIPNPTVLAWMSAQPAHSLGVSVVTQAEMMLGARLLPLGRRRHTLEQALRAMFSDDFAERIVPFDTSAVSHYVEIVTIRRRAGRPISQFDAQIAASALSQGMSLATRNVSDFDGCGVALINPFTAGR